MGTVNSGGIGGMMADGRDGHEDYYALIEALETSDRKIVSFRGY